MSEQRKDVAVVLKLHDQLTAGMTKVNGVLGGTGDFARRARIAFDGLKATALGVGSSLAGVVAIGAVIKRATDEARAAVENRQRLTVALGGNLDQLKRIQQLAGEIQAVSTIGDDDTIALAADLLNRGVAVRDIEKAIRATVEVSAALGKSLGEAGEQVAQTYGGTLPRELAKAIPALKTLTIEELRNGDAVDKLLDRYRQFATNLSQTPLGQIEQANNRIGDSFEGIGEIILKMQADVAPALADQVEAIAGLLDSDLVRDLGAGVSSLTREAVAGTPKVLTFAAAWTAVGLAIRGAGISGTVTGAALTSFKFTASAAAVLVLAERVSLAIDLLRGVSGELDTLEKRRQVVVDLVVNLVYERDVKAADVANSFVRDLLGRAGIDADFSNDADAVAAGNAAGKSDTDRKVAEQTAQFQRNGQKLRDLQDELNTILEQKDEESVKRRAAIELERLELLNDQKLISTGDYLRQRDQMERDALDRELGDAQARLDAAQKRLVDETNRPDKNEVITSDAVDAQEEINKLTAVLLEYRQKIDLLDQKQAARRSTTGQSAVAEAIASANEAQQRYNQTLENTANLEEVGAISSQDAKRRVAEAALRMEADLQGVTGRLRGLLADGVISQSEYDRVIQHIDGVANKAKQKVSELTVAMLSIRQQLQSPFENFFNDVIDGTKRAADAFRDLGNDILKTIQRVLVNRIVTQFLDTFLGAATGSGGFTPGIIGRLFVQRNSGGFIPGGGPDVDSVPAMLTPGEFVVRRRAAQQHAPFLAALNAGAFERFDLGEYLGIPRRPVLSIPRAGYNAGGPVGTAASGNAPAGRIVPAIVATEQTAATILRAGPNASRRMLVEHSDIIRQIARDEA
ncbi:MAG TPA: hypothetical protein VGN72_10060 [Tepidisphaeraceae bacterium]|jgi:hypothetical protein|nr:hypothetical protein [Tepidisphaeraceae bacterium]